MTFNNRPLLQTLASHSVHAHCLQGLCSSQSSSAMVQVSPPSADTSTLIMPCPPPLEAYPETLTKASPSLSANAWLKARVLVISRVVHNNIVYTFTYDIVLIYQNMCDHTYVCIRICIYAIIYAYIEHIRTYTRRTFASKELS